MNPAPKPLADWPKSESGLLIALFLAALVVRLVFERSPGLWAEEAQLVWRAQHLTTALFQPGDPTPFLYPLLLWVITHTVGYGEFWLRLPGLLASAGLVPLLYVAVAGLTSSRRAGWLAAALGLFSPASLVAAQTVTPDALLMLLALWHFHALAECLAGQRQAALALVGSAILMALAHQWGGPLLVAGSLLALQSRPRRESALPLGLSYGLGIPLALLSVIPYYLRVWPSLPHISLAFPWISIESWTQVLIKPAETVIASILTYPLYGHLESWVAQIGANFTAILTGAAVLGLALVLSPGHPARLWAWGVLAAVAVILLSQVMYASSAPGPYTAGPYASPPHYPVPFLGLFLVMLAVAAAHIRGRKARYIAASVLLAVELLVVLRTAQETPPLGPRSLARQIAVMNPEALFVRTSPPNPFSPAPAQVLAPLTFYLRLVERLDFPVIDLEDGQPVPAGFLQARPPLPPPLPPPPPPALPKGMLTPARPPQHPPPPDPNALARHRLAALLVGRRRVAILANSGELPTLLGAVPGWRPAQSVQLFNYREGARMLALLARS